MAANDLLVPSLVGLLAFAVFFHRKLDVASQGIRLEMAEVGERLLANPELPQKLRQNVGFILSRAFGMRAELIVGLVCGPVICAHMLLRPDSIRQYSIMLETTDPRIVRAYAHLLHLHDRVTLVNNPILKSLFDLEMGLCLNIGIFLVSLTRGKVPRHIDKNMLLSCVEREGLHWKPAI